MKTLANVFTALAWVVLGAIVLSVSAHAQEGTGSFTLSTTASEGLLTPTLTWQTDAPNCVASGDSEWEGPKPGNGTITLTPRPSSQPRAFALLCSWPGETQAMLTWIPPTQNTDGSALTNLAGYRVHYGTSSSALTNVVQIANPSASSYTIDSLTSGTWYFGVRAYTTQGAESAMSNVASRVIRAESVEWSQQTGIKVPAAPVLE